MLTIDPGDGRVYATVADDDQGVRITLWRRPLPGDHYAPDKQIETAVLECPFHVACDAAHALCERLNQENYE